MNGLALPITSCFEDGAPGAGAAALLEAAARQSFMLGPAWYATLAAHALPDGTRPRFYVVRDRAAVIGVFPVRQDGAALSALTAPYTILYAPAFAPGRAREAARCFARACARFGTVRLEALDGAAPDLPALMAGVRAAGLLPLRFAHFGNWHEPVMGLSWETYLAARPGALRETIRRREKRAAREPDLTVTLIEAGAMLHEAIAAFETVYARSWKEPEPFPRFNTALALLAAEAGLLWLGVLRCGAVPVAAQLWTLEPNGRATVHKLAHDRAYAALSPGTLLTAAVLRALFATGRLREIDYGRGDDAYKRGWTRRRRERIGLVLANPLHGAGATALARHAAGYAMRVLRTRASKERVGVADADPL